MLGLITSPPPVFIFLNDHKVSDESVLHLSSFEKTSDILYNAAYFGQKDSLAGPSSSLIMGMPITLGTGLFKLFQQPNYDPEKVKRKPIFFDSFEKDIYEGNTGR